jgi:hypothetical protein
VLARGHHEPDDPDDAEHRQHQDDAASDGHGGRFEHQVGQFGKTAALYKYPFEDHGPATLETNLDLWARWIAWLDLHVMNGEPEDTPMPDGGGGGR